MTSIEVIAEYMKGAHCGISAPQQCINPDLCCAHCNMYVTGNLCLLKSKGEEACMSLKDTTWNKCGNWVSGLEEHDMENNKYFQFAIAMGIGMLITIIDRKPDLVTAIFAAAFFVSAGQFLFREEDAEPAEPT